MALESINVNSADINSAFELWPDMPMDMMGLFFFAYRDFVRGSDAVLEKKGFGRAHHRVLYFVNIRPGMPVADLLGILKITKQSLARVLRQLIDEGYIEQSPGEVDRRQRLLYATGKGKALFEELSRLQAERINRALSALSEEDAKAVRGFLATMVDPEDRATLDQLRLTTSL